MSTPIRRPDSSIIPGAWRVIAAALLVPATVVAQGGNRPWTVDDVMAMKSVGNIAVSPDGRRIAYVVTERSLETNVANSDIWVVSVTGGDARRVTSGPRADRAPQWAGDGSWIAFLSDRGEPRRTQVYGIDPDGGEAWQLTQHPGSVGNFRVSPNGHGLLYTATGEPTSDERELERQRGAPIVRDSAYSSEFTRLWHIALTGRAPANGRAVSPDGIHVSAMVWAPDSRGLAFTGRPQPTLVADEHAVAYVQSEPGAESRPLTAMPGSETVVAWSRDLGLIFSSAGEYVGTANTELWTVPVVGGDPVLLTEGLDEDATFVAATGRELLVEAAVKTGRALFRIPISEGKASGPPAQISGDRFNSGFEAGGGTIAFLSETASEPPEVFATSGSPFAPRRLTTTNPQAANFGHGEQRVVTWTSAADSESIEGVLTLPVGYEEGSPVPLLVIPHGGPAGVSSARYPGIGSAYPVQVFASLGYAVLQPNFRGSTGYGKRFRGLNVGDILGKDWIDVNSGVDAMVRAGIADSTKLGLMGWSYGGFMTFWGVTATRRFAAASSGAGMVDANSFFSQTDVSDYLGMLFGGGPWEKRDLYRQHSAFEKVQDVTTPLLIQSGENDRRVSPEQSTQFYEAMKRIRKAPVKLVLYPGQGHGVNDVRLSRDRMQRNVDWFSYWVPVVGARPPIRMDGVPRQ